MYATLPRSPTEAAPNGPAKNCVYSQVKLRCWLPTVRLDAPPKEVNGLLWNKAKPSMQLKIQVFSQ